MKDNLKSPVVDILIQRGLPVPEGQPKPPESQDPWSSPVILLLSQGTALCPVKAALTHQHRYPFTTETQQSTAKILVKCFTCSKPGLEGFKPPSEYLCSYAEHSTKTGFKTLKRLTQHRWSRRFLPQMGLQGAPSLCHF